MLTVHAHIIAHVYYLFYKVIYSLSLKSALLAGQCIGSMQVLCHRMYTIGIYYMNFGDVAKHYSLYNVYIMFIYYNYSGALCFSRHWKKTQTSVAKEIGDQVNMYPLQITK